MPHTMITPTIQSILLIGYAAYEKMHLLPDFVREAAHCMMVCRTAVLGGHTQACPDGHYQRVWYNSCKHRMCPQCAYLQVQKWLAKQKRRILRCDHFHVIDGMRPQQVQNLMNKLGRKKWNVRICEKYPHGCGVLTYLARYLKGGPISNSRIIEVTDNNVTFNYGRKKRELMTLSINEFIHRFLKHIPQPNTILVRSYGLYSVNKRGELEKCRELPGCDSIAEPQKIKWQDCFEDSNNHPELCPICGKRLVMTSILKPTGMIPYPGAPPLLMPYLKEAA
jgi:hypothetical protein